MTGPWFGHPTDAQTASLAPVNGVVAVRTRAEVISRLREQEEELRRLGVERLSLFGSVARSAARSDSDVDLLVDFREGCKRFDSYLDLAELLERLLGRPVELLTRQSLSRHLGPRIIESSEDVLPAA
ncbi:MAG: nucleotidyltransferase [Acidobacteria bacterium]|nr:MAG: nucleotidyltransferase [Acidobacteriota bacterium]